MPSRFTMKRVNENSLPERGSEIRVSPFELAALLVRRKRIIAGSVLAVMILTAAITLLIPSTYTSVATILPSRGPDKMAELKSLAGLSGLMGQDENASELYPVILGSQTVRDAVLKATYTFDDDGEEQRLTLPAYFEQDNPDKLRRALAEITSVSSDKKTGVITIAVETEYPAFSQAILASYMDELESFNLHKRRSQARERATYLSRELTERKAELEAAEDSLAAFQAQNRDWMGSSDPDIAKLMARLKRVVETRGQTYFYLTQEYEIAKLDAQKDVPVVRILDQPTLPIQKSGPKRAAIVLTVGVLAFLVSLFGVIVFEAIRRSSRGSDRPAFEELRREFSQEFPRINRLVSRQPANIDG